MYCIDCGKQIPENSKFCSFCGAKQQSPDNDTLKIKEQIADAIITNEIVKTIKKNSDYEKVMIFLRKVLGYYLAWILLHLAILLIFSDGVFSGSNSNSGIDDFWPFDDYSGSRFARIHPTNPIFRY